MAFFRTIWKTNSKHKKLSEELALQNSKDHDLDLIETVENENDVVTFKLKYLGSTVVEKITAGETISAQAVKTIIKSKKNIRKKLQRVLVSISLQGIAVTDLQGNDILKVSIYRISNCSTDATHRQIFSFISTDSNETMECHAFVCSKRKLAETVTLAVAHAFSTAYEAWRILPTTRQFEKSVTHTKENQKNNINSIKVVEIAQEEKLIDFDEPCCPTEGIEEEAPQNNSQWVCFEDDFAKEAPKIPYHNHNQIDLIFA